jgi:outer membrane protein assembly factor BamA
MRGALRIKLRLDSREDEDYPENAWLLGLAIEPGRINPDATGQQDYNYAAFTVEANRYTRLPYGLQWDIGTRLSSSFDRIPTQLYQTLNGYGGIRGTDDAPFDVVRGDRMVRLSTEFRMDLPDVPIIKWIYSRWDLVVFGDAGYLTQADNPTSVLGFLGTSFSQWKKSVGFGVSGESLLPYLGFYVAREIDGDRDRPRFIVRLERSF